MACDGFGLGGFDIVVSRFVSGRPFRYLPRLTAFNLPVKRVEMGIRVAPRWFSASIDEQWQTDENSSTDEKYSDIDRGASGCNLRRRDETEQESCKSAEDTDCTDDNLSEFSSGDDESTFLVRLRTTQADEGSLYTSDAAAE